MSNVDLTKYGITGTTEIIYNPSYEKLFEDEMDPNLTGYAKGHLSDLGAVDVFTGEFTGRSPWPTQGGAPTADTCVLSPYP